MKFFLITLFLIIPEKSVKLKEVRIYGGSYIYSLEERIYLFEDGVELYGENFSVKGDVALYDAVSKELYALGNITALFNGEVIEGEYLYLNFNTGMGEIFDVDMKVKRGIYTVKADVVIRKGEKHYELNCSSFTPCQCPEGPPSWSISGEKMTLKGDRFSIRKGFFLLKDLPVFYIPYISVPVLRERKTGFLFPEFVYSARDGYEFFLPFFWAIDVDKDLTLEASTFTSRGAGGKGTFRYALPGNKFLHLQGEFFWEGMLDGDLRYLINGWGRFPFTFVNASFEGAYPSDRNYLKDYARYVDVAYSGSIDSRFFISSQAVNWYGTFWGRYVENLKNEENDLQVFPAFTFSLYPPSRFRWMRIEAQGAFRNYIEEGKASVREFTFLPSVYFYLPVSFLESHFRSSVELTFENSSFKWNPWGEVYLSLPLDVYRFLSIKPYFEGGFFKEEDYVIYLERIDSTLKLSSGVKVYLIKDGRRILRLRGWVEHREVDSVNYELLFSLKRWASLKVEGAHAEGRDYLSSSISMSDSRGDGISASWFSFRNESYKRRSLNISLSFKLHWQLLFSSNFAISTSPFSLVQAVYTVSYKSACDCWGIKFSYIDRQGTENDRFSITIYLTGLGEFGTL